jgi:hypothetical protein
MECTQQVVRIGFEMVKVEKGVDGFGGNRQNRWGFVTKTLLGSNGRIPVSKETQLKKHKFVAHRNI